MRWQVFSFSGRASAEVNGRVGARCFGLSLMQSAVCLALVLAAGCRTVDRWNRPDPALRALAERAEIAKAAAGDSVGREYANRLRSETKPDFLQYWQGSGPKPEPDEELAIRDITHSVEMVEAAASWPEPGTYEIPKAAVAPVIDGNLDDPAWQQAAVWTEIYPFNSTEPGGPETTWRMLWDDEYLYFAFDCVDTDIVAAARDRDGPVWRDDCVEMFIMPDFRFRTYWEIVIAPNGSVYDSVQCKRMNLWGANHDPAQDVEGMLHAQTIRGTLNQSDDVDDGYTVEVAVPFAALPGYSRSRPQPGDRLHFMLVRLDRSHGEFTPYAFRPLQGWGHNIWNHATMILGDVSESVEIDAAEHENTE